MRRQKIMASKENQEANLIVFDEIENKIYNIRGERVMLDSDLAEIYGVKTRVLKQAVRRNLHRFPTDFMFELTLEELRSLESLRSQIVTLEAENRNAENTANTLRSLLPRLAR